MKGIKLVLLAFVLNAVFLECEARDKSVWKFCFSLDGFPANYINQTTGELVGQSVDMVKKICELSKKTCNLTSVARVDCWDDSTLRSKSLDEDTCDVCANLVESPDRNTNYRFAKQDIYRIPDPTLIRKPGNTAVDMDVLKTCHDFVLAYPGLTALNRDCLLAAGLFVKEANVVPVVATGSIVAALSEIADKVLDDTDPVDIGLVIPRLLFRTDVETFGSSPCLSTLIGLNMMINQTDARSDDFLAWWEPTLEDFICAKLKEDKNNPPDVYALFCQDMQNKYFGTDPLCYTPGVDVSCPKFPVPPPGPDPGPIDPCN